MNTDYHGLYKTGDAGRVDLVLNAQNMTYVIFHFIIK